MNRTIAIVVGALVLVTFLLFSMTYTVRFHEVAIRTRFGQVGEGSVVTTPGLKFRLPFFIDRVAKFDTRTQYLETPLKEQPTVDGQQVVVRAFLMWQIDTQGDGPMQFFKKFQTPENAQRMLGDDFEAALGAISRYRFDELIGEKSRLPEVEAQIKQAMSSARANGVIAVNVGISQMLLPAKTTQVVTSNMSKARRQQADLVRSLGKAEANALASRMQAQANKILSFAAERATAIRGKGNDQAAEYMRQMAQDQELAIFLSWLDALDQSLSERTTVMLPAEFAPFHLLNLASRMSAKGIPQPEKSYLDGPAAVANDGGE